MGWKFEEEFRKDKPETIGETDSRFDLDNYKDWLEEQLSEARSKLHQPTVISSVYCRQCGKKFKDGLSENLHNMEEH